jgi:tetratricopeptide (TPR) repeat protein
LLSNWNEARHDLELLLRLLPEDTDAYRMKSLYEVYSAQYAAVVDSCTKAIAIDPDIPELYTRRARGFLGLAEYQKAATDCDHALEMWSSTPESAAHQRYYAYRNRSWARRELGDVTGALADARKAISIDPVKPDGYEHLVATLIVADDWKEALETCQLLVSKYPGTARYWLLLLDVSEHMHRRQLLPDDESQAILRHVHSSVADADFKLEVVFQLAAYQVLRGDEEAYENGCRQMFSEHADSDNARNMYLVARMCSLVRRPPVSPTKVVELAARAAGSETTAWYQHTLGLSLLRTGDHRRAIEEFGRSLALSGGDPLNQLALALAHHAAGDTDEARKLFQEMKELLDPTAFDLGWSTPLHPHDRIACELLLREAEAVIGQ